MALPFYASGHAEQAANTIVREAAKTWKEREDVVDDITCVVVFMDIKLVEKSLKFKETNKMSSNILQSNVDTVNLPKKESMKSLANASPNSK
jgi:hypothetical protein